MHGGILEVSLLDKIRCFLNPLTCKKAKRGTPLDQYIESRNPQTLEDVERFAKEYLNGASPWRFNNDNLYR